MVILGLKLDGIMSFSEFEINFSYPIKLRNTLIKDENLESIPSFRYKKLNIFIGSNASGKTSLIKTIWQILLFLNQKEKNILLPLINKNSETGYIEMDFVNGRKENYTLNRIKIKLDNLNNDIDIAFKSIPLNAGSSYENKEKDLNNFDYKYHNYLTVLNSIDFIGGYKVIMPATENAFNYIKFIKMHNESEEADYLEILKSVLKTLDNSIINVFKSSEAANAYIIEHLDAGRIIVQEGYKLSDIPLLSSGTKYGFNIANMIYAIKTHRNGIYLIDEQFSYVNSDIEAAILSTIVSLLGPDEQIFFTTHNSSILDLGFPFHAFNFMKKERFGNKQKISTFCASEAENRNNVSAKTLLDNDVFGTSPDLNDIFNLGDNIDA